MPHLPNRIVHENLLRLPWDHKNKYITILNGNVLVHEVQVQCVCLVDSRVVT